MTPEEVWQRKTDRDVLIASHQLESYTQDGRRVILAEVERRGLSIGPAGLYGDAGETQSPGESVDHLDEAQVQLAMDQLRSQQNLVAGAVAGLAAAAVGAAAWAATTVGTGYHLGVIAVLVGLLVGVAVRAAGKGIDKAFGFIGAALSLLGCAAGNLLAVCGIIANEKGLALLDVVSRLNPGIALELMFAAFSPTDLVFYGIAMYEGFRFSMRRISQEELAQLLGRS